MNEVMAYVLSMGIGYVGADVLVYAVALLLCRDFSASLRLSRRAASVVLGLVTLQAVLLLVSAVYVAVRWPALAVFPALGACWVGADAPALFAVARGNDGEWESAASPAAVFGGVALLVGMVTTFVAQVRSL